MPYKAQQAPLGGRRFGVEMLAPPLLLGFNLNNFTYMLVATFNLPCCSKLF